jgi:excinuclease ABC subunit B
VLYADTMTDSIRRALAETERRRAMQIDYNVQHGITPQTIRKPIREKEVDIKDIRHVPKAEIPNLVIELEAEMREAAERLEFERAIALRDTIRRLQGEGAAKKARG